MRKFTFREGFAFLAVFFLAIALATYFTGCNPNVKNGCMTYDPFDPGYIYDQKLVKETCKDCKRRSNGKCQSYKHYDCYSAYAYADKGANSSSWCKLEVVRRDKSKSDAQDKLDKYTIGKEVHWLKLKNSDMCRTQESAYGLWVTGVVFFGLFGCAVLIPVGTTIYSRYSDPTKQRQLAYDDPTNEGDKFQGPGVVQVM